MTSSSPLSPGERETVLLMSDADEYAEITTHQAPIITRLGKNPSAILVAEGRHGTTRWAHFRIPAKLVSFRSKTTKRPLTEQQCAEKRLQLATARQGRQKRGKAA